MPNLPSNNQNNTGLEPIIADAIGPDSLPCFSADDAFLQSLQRKLNNMVPPRSPSYRLWIDGLSRGAVAAACGFILFTSLNILPSILVNSTVTGACLAQQNIVELSWRSRVLWQQFVVSLENQMR
jgi:hypothetical protein